MITRDGDVASAAQGEDDAGMPSKALLDIRGLRVELPPGADRAHAVDDVTVMLRRDEILCVVGESGSG
ncbi:MAG TPA: hypothetical protein VFB54_03960, partial [Burkholderiales bacterium]|nr:hypothetical protein [Burkholderiales bacterium]